MECTHNVIMTTTDSEDEARRLAASLVERRLAACVQLTSVESHYLWNGALQRTAEWLLVIKTVAHRFDDVERFLHEHHSYDVPEIVSLPVARGSAAYLNWVTESTR